MSTEPDFGPEPPAWEPGDAAPATTLPSKAYRQRPQPQNAVAKVEAAAFEEGWKLDAPLIRKMLPSHIDFDMFERVAMVAVQRMPKLLNLDRRALFLAFQDAAACGLLPDGREGAIVPRWNSIARTEIPVFQAMVWGIYKLARQAGIKKFAAHIVFEGEPFRAILAPVERYEHERKIECWDMTKATLVYAHAEMADGTEVWRHMPASKVLAIKKAVAFKADGSKTNTPWNGPHEDEQWVKTGLRFLSKWLELSSSDDNRRLRAALEIDDADDAIEHVTGKTINQEAAPDKLDALVNEVTIPPIDLGKPVAEKVPAEPTTEPTQQIKAEPAPEPTKAAKPAAPTAAELAAARASDGIIADIKAAKDTHALADLFRNKAVTARIDRFREAYPHLHEQIMAAHAQAEQSFGPPAAEAA